MLKFTSKKRNTDYNIYSMAQATLVDSIVRGEIKIIGKFQ
jgi:hypothetical protein